MRVLDRIFKALSMQAEHAENSTWQIQDPRPLSQPGIWNLKFFHVGRVSRGCLKTPGISFFCGWPERRRLAGMTVVCCLNSSAGETPALRPKMSAILFFQLPQCFETASGDTAALVVWTLRIPKCAFFKGDLTIKYSDSI
jgi:hypothetical protein